MAKNYNKKGKVIGMNSGKGPTRDKPGLNAQINIKPEDMIDICCENCGGKVKRIITGGTGLIFKGSGFYLTDYKDGKKSPDTDSASTLEDYGEGKKTETGKKDKTVTKECSEGYRLTLRVTVTPLHEIRLRAF